MSLLVRSVNWVVLAIMAEMGAEVAWDESALHMTKFWERGSG